MIRNILESIEYINVTGTAGFSHGFDFERGRSLSDCATNNHMAMQPENSTNRAQQANEIKIQQFWPTTFFTRTWKDHENEVSGIIEFLYQLKSKSEENIASGIATKSKSDDGLFESDFDLFSANHGGILKLKRFIEDTVRQVVSKLHNHQIEPNLIEVEIADGWFHITNEGGFHDSHGHQHCSWCGIYYVQIGDSLRQTRQGAPNGGNRFYSPFLIGGQYVDLGNQYLSRTYLDPPIEDGMLLLFPSYLQHSALPYRGEQDRVVIAFNSRSTRR